MLLENDEVASTVGNADGGFIDFGTMYYDEPGTHTYIVRPMTGTEYGIEYDNHEETVVVTVSDVDGHLVANVEPDDDGVKFNHRMLPGALCVFNYANGLTEKNANSRFKFKVKLHNENGTPFNGKDIEWRVENSTNSTTGSGGNI